MAYWFFQHFVGAVPVLNLLRYITFRTACATLTALFLCFIIGPRVIRWLKKKQKQGQPIRIDGPETHLLTKQGTPTMGGCLILGTVVLSTLFWGNLENAYVWILIIITTGFGILGGIDDYYKLTRRSSAGLSARMKFALQCILSFIAVYWILSLAPANGAGKLAIPFFKETLIDLKLFFVPFAMVVIVGASNAVNLTDGLDGLAIVPVMMCAICFSIIAYLAGNVIFANYLQIHYVPGAAELMVFCGAMVGASLGFLWFNAPPASVFMGDTGSVALGGALGTIAVITKHELVLVIIGGLFVLETVSVIIQVVYFKMTKRRVFLMAPIHHHFEKKGWSEPTVVIRFWIISIILALIGMTTLKLR